MTDPSERGDAHRQGEGDWGEAQRDPEQQADAEVNLDDPSATDDVPWSPPDRQPRGAGMVGIETTPDGETLDQRILQEEPEDGTAYGAPGRGVEDDEAVMLGGDDPDAIPAEDDVLGGAPGDDLPLDADSPEGSAMRVVEDPEA